MPRPLAPLLAVPLALACQKTPSPIAASETERAQTAEDFAARAEAFFQAELEARPAMGSDLGFHEYDGRLPDLSRAALKAYAERLTKERKAFAAIEVKGDREEYERQLILNHIDSELFDLNTARTPFRNPMSYPWMLDLAGYVARDYAPVDVRARGLSAVCEGAPKLFATAQANLETPIPKTWVKTALLQVRGMRSFVTNDIPAAMVGLHDDGMKTLKAALGTCDGALGDFETYLVAQEAKASNDFALGSERFREMLLKTEALDIDLERLRAIGEQDLERNLASLAAAAKKMGKTVGAAVAATSADKPAADAVLSTAAEQSAQMREFLIDRKIVTIPSEDVAEVKASPAFMRWNFAFLSSAGAFEKKALPSFYYISPPDPSWSEEVQKGYIQSRHDLLFVTIHEVWPGHFLHSLHAKKNGSKIANAFCSYAMSEGWAHYTEEMMFDAGAGGGDPKTHIGQLKNALLRNARYLSAIGLHTEGMTVEASKSMFVEQGLQDEGSAMQQAVRGTFDPGYLKYTLGKLMIRKLHDDWKAKVGDAYSLQRFHDTFLSYQCAPVPVIRELMLGTRDGVL